MRNYKENYMEYLSSGKNSMFRVDLHIIGGCNFKCVMCDNWKKKTEIILNYKQLQKTIVILKQKYNCNYIRFHGQEPLMYRKIEDLIFLCKKLQIKTALKTNGWLLTDTRLIKLLHYGLNELYLSIDSPINVIHDSIRGVKGSFDKNIDIIKKTKKIKPNTQVYINSVIMIQNYEDIDKMINIGKKYNIDRVSFVFLNDKNTKNITPINLTEKEFVDFFKKQVIQIYEKSLLFNIPVDFSPFISTLSGRDNITIIQELKNNFTKYKYEIASFYEGNYGKYFYDRYGCFGPLDHASINYDGYLYGCCVVERNNSVSVGNIIDDDLEYLWSSKKYKAYRQFSNTNCKYSIKCASNFYSRKKLFKEIYLDDFLYNKNYYINYYRYLKELYYENNRIVEKQKVTKLIKILIHFYDSLPFYQKLLKKNGIDRKIIKNITSVDFIYKIPVLTKKFLKEHMKEIKTIISSEALIGSTSGTSGNKFLFYYPNNFQRYIKQIAIFSEEFSFTINDSYFSLTPDNCNQFIIDSIKVPSYVNKVYLPVSGNFDFGRNYFLELNTFFHKHSSIKYLHADSKYLLYIVLGYQKFGFTLPNLQAISLTYGYTNLSLKKYLENLFGCEIYDNYGCSETGPISIDTIEGSKIFGDNILAFDRNNEIIVSDLDNYDFPFINYKNGDIGTVRGDIINILGKDSQIILGKSIQEIDKFLYKNYPKLITFQIIDNNFYFISQSEIDIKILEKRLLDFLEKSIKCFRLKESFLKISNDCSKFKFVL